MVKKLFTAFSLLEKIEVLVIGDLMLDRYTSGKVGRISPEAPVPVLHADEEHALPGGAGNVMLGLVALGATVHAMGRVGYDQAGEILQSLLSQEKINTAGIFVQEDYRTPEKRRIIADNHHLLRIDHEKIAPPSKELEEQIIDSFSQILPQISVVAISDYGKGFLTKELLQKLIARAQKAKVPVLVDPKGLDFSKYSGATLVKPNCKEAYLASGLSQEASLEEVSESIFSKSKIENLVITRSEEGISLFSQNTREDFATEAKEIKDVTGAGDTVLATIAMAVGSKISLVEACQLANYTASVAIEHVGCKPVTLSQLAERLLKNSANAKIFEEHHLFALKELLKDQPFILLGMDQESVASIKWIDALQELAKEKIILYVSEKTPRHYLSLLASLKEISFLILGSQSLTELCSEIGPRRVYVFEDESLHQLDEAVALLKRLSNESIV
ncbi:MAG: D-glycero-beta-D-manno-heptose-7-phosphate kinase [Candidatus Algichlamydia australiensis]|nr:D-glycero-beta-D-manno-heptose-7-phosphate kinase [Chlamydiales bacterium]